MTNPETSSPETTNPEPQDPRFGFAAVTEAVGALIDSVEVQDPPKLNAPTPCPKFTVDILLDHVVMVMRRVAVLGNGGHWSEIDQESLGSGWAADYRSAAHDIMAAWTDAAKLEQTFEVPWGEFPGGLILYTYTAELAVHGWDLATATGLDFTVADEHLHGALEAAKFIPADDRGSEDMPFSQVVDPGPDAPVLEQIAGWLGRNVGS